MLTIAHHVVYVLHQKGQLMARRVLAKGVTVCLVLDEAQVQMLKGLAHSRMCSVSQVAREAIRAYLSEAAPPPVLRAPVKGPLSE